MMSRVPWYVSCSSSASDFARGEIAQASDCIALMDFVAEQAGKAPTWIREGVILTHSNSAITDQVLIHPFLHQYSKATYETQRIIIELQILVLRLVSMWVRLYAMVCDEADVD